MSFEWPIDKLSLINSALSQTGDNLIVVLDDGSDEYAVASPSYERALAYIMESGNWGYATDVRTLVPAGNAPNDTSWDTAYNLPSDLVHLIWMKLAAVSGDPTLSTQPSLAPYAILAGQLVTNAQGGPPPPPAGTVTPAQCTIKAVFRTNTDPTFSTPTFVIALQAFVMAGIYRGLHEDTGEADKIWQAGEHYLMVAKAKYDQQMPKRAFFNHRITAVRRIRRPWPPQGGEWGGPGGSGVPG